MAEPISPGVYTTITEIRSYVEAVPSTIGCVCSLTPKGEDNVLKFFGSRSEFINECGEPDITVYGKNYGQGPYISYNFLGESGSLFHMRCLPDDAQFANVRIDIVDNPLDSTSDFDINLTYVDSLNTKAEIATNLQASGSTNPLCILRPIGRGQAYNEIGVRISEYANPMYDDVYVLDVYERQDGDDVIIETFEISFNPMARDISGASIFIADILNVYSAVLRCDIMINDETYSPGFDLVGKVYDNNVGTVALDLVSGLLSDDRQDFDPWDSDTGESNYIVIAKDATGNKIWGWMGQATGVDSEAVEIFDSKNLSTGNRGWLGNTAEFDVNGEITYRVKKSVDKVSSAFTSSNPVPLRKGSDGSLLDSAGNLDSVVATQVLAQAYSGLLDETITDYENVYFNLVFDAGYPSDVKTQIAALVQLRRDCIAILDNGDNATFNTSLETRKTTHTFNTYLVALYEEYSKVYDIFTGRDVWFSPVYHMAYIIPRSDNIRDIFWAPAGSERGIIDSIKEMRFNPKRGQRDQNHLKQLNPIVRFDDGYYPYGQLTSQSKPGPLQNIPVTRLVLYCKRALEQYCKHYIFQQNDEITWSAIAGDIVEFLERIKQDRGLYSYNVDVGATEYEKKRKMCHVNVDLEPVLGLEKIKLNFFVR